MPLATRLKERLNRSAFFFGAVLAHLVLFLMLVGYVVWEDPAPPKDLVFGPVPPPQAPVSHSQQVDTTEMAGHLIDLSVIHTKIDLAGAPPALPHFDDLKNHDLDPGTVFSHDPGPPVVTPGSPGSPDRGWVDLPAAKRMREKWRHDGNFLVPIYLARYADGDWDCNAYLHNGRLDAGCLPNLMAKIQDWSNGEIKGRDLKVVALDSAQILDDPPPFIFFTGHRDFRLTDAEIANLRAYLQMGGCLWGDSAFAGAGSRFDVAFHREIRRVLPDQDLRFEPLPADDAIFTQGRFPIDELPPGMNERADPIECIRLGGKVAILYTPNDYSDMMTMLLQPGRNESEARQDPHFEWTADHPLFTPASFTGHAATYYRNYEPASAMGAYKLSMNILVPLLHQYDDDLLLTP